MIQGTATPLPPVRIRVAPLSPDFLVRTFSFSRIAVKDFRAGKNPPEPLEKNSCMDGLG